MEYIDIKEKLTTDQLLKDQQNKEIRREINRLAQQQACQMFYDIYMAPGDFGDINYRLGSVVANVDGTEGVDCSDFPPYIQGNKAYAEKLPLRIGGFKSVNDRINYIQSLLRQVTGQVRTKLTEWDLSLYLQNHVPGEVKAYTTLYGLFEKAAQEGTHIGAELLTKYGILNAAVSPFRGDRWNPSTDEDLVEWVPPTSDEVLRSEEVPTGLTDDQMYDLAIARALRWDSWYPRFWQIFHMSEDLDSLGDEDGMVSGCSDPSIDAESGYSKKWLSALRGKSKATTNARNMANQIQGAAGGDSTSLKAVNSIGISGQNPFMYGRPFGKNLAKGSLKQIRDTSTPVLSTSLESTDPHNKAYIAYNPMQGKDVLDSGWESTIDKWVVDHYVERSQYVKGNPYSDGADDWWGRSYNEDGEMGYYTKVSRPVFVQKRTQVTEQVYNPDASITIQQPTSLEAQGVSYGYLTPSQSYIIKNINTKARNVLDSILQNSLGQEDGKTPIVPVAITSADGKTFAIVDITRGIMKVERPYTVWKWKWWFKKRPVTRYEIIDKPCYWVSPSARMFNTNLTKNDNTRFTDTAYTSFKEYMTRVGASQFTGLFFKIDARELTDSSNYVTDGWGPHYEGKGPQIARAFLHPIWKKDSVQYGVTMQKLYYDAYQRFKDVTPALTTLIDIFNSFTVASINAAFGELEDEVQQQPDVIAAKSILQDIETVTKKMKKLSSDLDSFITLFAPIGTSCSEEDLTKNLLTDGFSLYKNILDLVGSGLIDRLVDAYLTLLYEWRLVYVKQRMNKADGTLVSLARVEIANELFEETLGESPNPFGGLIKPLTVVHVAKTNTLAAKANAKRDGTVLPLDRIKKVYVKVQYDDDGEIVRPESGEYSLTSTEYQQLIEKDAAKPYETRFYIHFDALRQPKIIKNVMNGMLDITELQQLMTNTNLSAMEKLCATRTLDDWWEIPIPEAKQPPAVVFVTDVALVLPPKIKDVESLMTVFGDIGISPIKEDQGKKIVGVNQPN